MKALYPILFCFILTACRTDVNKEELFLNHEKELQHKVQPDSSKGLQPQETVVIGTQEWMTKNLDVDTFRNGDAIPEMRSDEDWEEAGNSGLPAWSYFNNDKNNSYGRLYNFHAVEDSRCLCPEGWRIPTDEDWIKLELEVGNNIAYHLKSKAGWHKNGNGIDSYGFNALPNGMRYYDGQFFYFNESAFWWTASSVVLKHAWLRYLEFDYSDRIFRLTARKHAGFAVRCVKDYSENDFTN